MNVQANMDWLAVSLVVSRWWQFTGDDLWVLQVVATHWDNIWGLQVVVAVHWGWPLGSPGSGSSLGWPLGSSGGNSLGLSLGSAGGGGSSLGMCRKSSNCSKAMVTDTNKCNEMLSHYTILLPNTSSLY